MMNPAKQTPAGTESEPADTGTPPDMEAAPTSMPFRFLWILTLALILVALALYGHYGYRLFNYLTAGPQSSDVTRTVEVTVGGAIFDIPENVIRTRSGRKSGNVERIELSVHWPSLQGYSKALKQDFDLRGQASPILHLTLYRPEHVFTANERLKEIYSPLFSAAPRNGPDGLKHHANLKGGGYEGQDIYQGEHGGHTYVARCFADSAADKPTVCLREYALNGTVSVYYRFRSPLLPQWRRIDEGVRALVKSFQRPMPDAGPPPLKGSKS